MYSYTRPAKLEVQESTPTADQINFYARPRQLRAGEASFGAGSAVGAPVQPVELGPVNVVRLAFKDPSGATVPTLLCTPKGRNAPFPVVIAVHGLHSNKAQVCGQLAPSLAAKGFAVLSPDMPLHGERPGSPSALFSKKDWLGAIAAHHQAILNIRQSIDLAETRKELDTSRGVILAGYSMGSWLNSIVGPADDRVRAMVLMVGGATDSGPLVKAFPALAAADPTQVLPHFKGRPLLLLNGRYDTTVTEDMAERLLACAPEPKEHRWYECGHRLSDEAYEDAASWIAKTWRTLARGTD
jgi:dienelactone hydrolase